MHCRERLPPRSNSSPRASSASPRCCPRALPAFAKHSSDLAAIGYVLPMRHLGLLELTSLVVVGIVGCAAQPAASTPAPAPSETVWPTPATAEPPAPPAPA